MIQSALSRSRADYKKDSLFRNSLDEYSEQVNLKQSVASACRLKQNSQISLAFEHSKDELNRHRHDQCSESNLSYNVIMNTQNMSSMALGPQMRSSQSLRRKNQEADREDRESMANVNQSISESDPGWIMGGSRAGTNGANHHQHQADLHKDKLYHSKSVNLYSKDSV